jgi:hypothetical protein
MSAAAVLRLLRPSVLLVSLCAPVIALAQFAGRTPLTSSVPLKCEGGIRPLMTVIYMGSSSLVSLSYEGKWLDMSLAGPAESARWIFQDKSGELRWTMREREGILERGEAVLARCATYLPVEVIMQPIGGGR